MELFNYLRTQKNFYENNTIPLFGGVEFSQPDLISQIDHYSMDLYWDGVDASDDIIGDYPFDNISKFRVLLEARATDFDIKHVELEPINGSREARVSSMIASKSVQKHMRDINFGTFMNDACYTRAKYGGVLATKVGEEMKVIPWQNVITDMSDIMSGIRIVRHYLTPSEILKKKDVWKNVELAVKTAQDMREKDMESGGRNDAETQGDLIEVWETQGDVPKSMFLEAEARMNGEDYEWKEEHDFEYVPIKVIMCGAEWVEDVLDEKTGKKIGQEDKGLVLYAKEQPTDQYFIARNPIAGRAIGEGVVESLFEHQKWHNYTKTEEMRAIAIANKILYLTDDPDVLANIFDEGVDHGTVLKKSPGTMFQQLNQMPTSLPALQNIRQELDESASRTTSSFGAKLGEEAKAGTPFRAQYLQNVEASSQFEQYREEMALKFFQPIIKEQILPDALKKASKDDEIYTTFSPQELLLIDEVITEKAVLDEVVKRTLERTVVSPEEVQMFREQATLKLQREGNKRVISEIKDFIKKAGDKVVIHTTDEARNKAVFFESMANLLQILSPEDPARSAVIDRIMDSIGVTKEELAMYGQNMPSQAKPNIQQEQMKRETQVGANLIPA